MPPVLTNTELSSTALRSAAEDVVLAAAIYGDAAAFSELVRRRQATTRQLLRRLCRDTTLADDLAQQVYLQAWRSLRSLKSPLAFNAWLRKLTVNVWLQHVRAKHIETQSDVELLETFTDAANDSSAAAIQLDLDAALARLPPDVRLCVVLAYHEGLSHGEICAATALPLGTVKSHVSRGVTRLRNLLQAYETAIG